MVDDGEVGGGVVRVWCCATPAEEPDVHDAYPGPFTLCAVELSDDVVAFLCFGDGRSPGATPWFGYAVRGAVVAKFADPDGFSAVAVTFHDFAEEDDSRDVGAGVEGAIEVLEGVCRVPA